MFNKKKKENDFQKNVNVNFNTFQINISDDQKDDFAQVLKDILEELPNVQESYSCDTDGEIPRTNMKQADLYNQWMDALMQAANVTMSILRKKPQWKYGGVDEINITENGIKTL